MAALRRIATLISLALAAMLPVGAHGWSQPRGLRLHHRLPTLLQRRRASLVHGAAIAPPATAPVAAADEVETAEEAEARRAFEAQASQWDTRKEVRKVVAFCAPAASTTLAEPLMSFIDTVCVGSAKASTLSLAALGPNVVIFNTLLWTFCFLASATTIEVSLLLAQQDEAAAQRIVSMALVIAVGLGVATTAGLLAFSTPLIAATGANPAIVPAAVSYLRVRALSAPAVLVSMVLQATLLAQRDALTPLRIILATSFANIVGDATLILGFGQGLVGAALATTAAQWLAVPLFLWLGFWRPGAKSRVSLQWARPLTADIKRFLKRSASISVIFVSLNTSFLLLCSRATTFSTVASAAHQAMWSMFNLLMSATMPLQQATQVFLPTYLEADAMRGPKAPRTAEKLLDVLMGVGLGAGLLLGTIGLCTPHLIPHVFTKDMRLWPIMRSFSGATFVSLLLAGAVQVVDGAYLAMDGIGYLVRCSCLNVAVVAGYLWWAITVQGSGVQAVWKGLTLLYLVRAGESGAWIARKRRQRARARAEAATAAAA